MYLGDWFGWDLKTTFWLGFLKKVIDFFFMVGSYSALDSTLGQLCGLLKSLTKLGGLGS